jgi:hypothetical protein
MIMTTGYQQAPAQANGQPVPAALLQGLRTAIHGWQKAGKSSICDTGPRPRLLLDSEQAALWLPTRGAGRMIFWDPKRATVPRDDGTWDTCAVTVYDHEVPFLVLNTLRTGQHPFNTVTLDSTSNLQQRTIMGMRGTAAMRQEDWGSLLRVVNAMITGYGDLVSNPVKRVWSVNFIAGTKWDPVAKKQRLMLQGASQDYIPYVPEIQGYVYDAGDGTRRMWIGGSRPDIEAGNRLWGRLPDEMILGYPGLVPGWTIEAMVTRALGLG